LRGLQDLNVLARVDYGLGLTLASHGARGNVAWLIEALQVVGFEPVAVEGPERDGAFRARTFGAE
jgi:hypothetical protein